MLTIRVSSSSFAGRCSNDDAGRCAAKAASVCATRVRVCEAVSLNQRNFPAQRVTTQSINQSIDNRFRGNWRARASSSGRSERLDSRSKHAHSAQGFRRFSPNSQLFCADNIARFCGFVVFVSSIVVLTLLFNSVFFFCTAKVHSNVHQLRTTVALSAGFSVV
jgi:hypothetical protein